MGLVHVPLKVMGVKVVVDSRRLGSQVAPPMPPTTTSRTFNDDCSTRTAWGCENGVIEGGGGGGRGEVEEEEEGNSESSSSSAEMEISLPVTNLEGAASIHVVKLVAGGDAEASLSRSVATAAAADVENVPPAAGLSTHITTFIHAVFKRLNSYILSID